MNTLHPLMRAAMWCALCGGASLAHAADKPGALPPAADPELVVPATRYQPAMLYRPAPAPQASPAQHWRALNAQVGSYDSMSLTVQDTDAPEGTQTPAAPVATDPHPGHKHKEDK